MAAGPDVGRLVAVVGREHVRAGEAGDEVQGARPALVVTPGDEDEVAGVLREASRQGLAVVARGGGTKTSWGAPPTRCDVVLSTRRLSSIDHQPGDLVCVAGAGTTLADVQAALAAAPGTPQRLALDPPQGGAATLGGIVATSASGPLRSRYGTPRDLLIGVRFVLADGTAGHAGGRVVKNVAGYDVGKLLTGSLGTLAIISQVAFKLHPLAPSSRTVVLENASARALAAFTGAVDVLPVTPSSVDVLWPQALAAVRFESSEEGARRQAEVVADQAGGRVLAGAEAEAIDAELSRRPWDGDGCIAGVAVPRTAVGELLEVASDFAADLVLRAGTATGEARLPEDPAVVVGLRDAVTRLGGHLMLHRCGPSLGALVWPAADAVTIELSRSAKRRLDPACVLAPGRFLGGI